MATHIAVSLGSLRFDSQARQIGRNVDNGAMFFWSCIAQALSRGDRPPPLPEMGSNY